jgi:hypothetical protein
MIQLIPKTPEAELLNIFGNFFKDDQDSVRMQGIDSCVMFAMHLPASVSLVLNNVTRKLMLIYYLTLRSLLRIRVGESDI